MSYLELVFNNRKPNHDKLLAFGFKASAGGYSYATLIAERQFLLTVTLDDDGQVVGTTVFDNAANDEYVLHLMPRAEGAFVGAVRADYEDILREIASQCFEADVFKSDYAQAVIQHVRATYGDEPEFLWPRTPAGAVYRRKDTDKWYALMMTISKSKLGLASDESVDVLNVKMKPEEIAALIDGIQYHQAYHMNKRHWVSICLDGSLPIAEIFAKIAVSYALAGR